MIALTLAALVVPALATGEPLVAGWGWDANGQLGAELTPDGSAHGVPVPIAGTGDVVAVSSNDGRTLGLQANGTVLAWGGVSPGPVGQAEDTPKLVEGLSGVTEVAAGTESLVLLANDTVDLLHGRRLHPHPVRGISGGVAIAATGGHYLVVLADGTVMAWGRNSSGQLGDGSTEASSTPVTVTGIDEAVAVSAGPEDSAAVLANGTVMTWGSNSFGQLGDGTQTDRHVPVQVSGLNEAVAVAVGTGHMLARLHDGSVMAWGINGAGALGIGNTSGEPGCTLDDCYARPVPVSSVVDGALEIAAGRNFSLALMPDGTVLAWGTDWIGELGDGNDDQQSLSDVPVKACGVSGATAITAAQSGSGFAVGSALSPCPALESLAPADGSPAGGTQVTLNGSNLTGVEAVDFGGVPATSFSVLSPSSILAVAPPGSMGTADVTASTATVTTKVLRHDHFTYVQPPDFGDCIDEGEALTAVFANKTCTVLGEAFAKQTRWRWVPGPTGPLQWRRAGGKPTLETTAGAKIICADASAVGQYAGEAGLDAGIALDDVVLTFTGCERGGVSCTSSGGVSGELQTATLDGRLGRLEGTGEPAGLDLSAAGGGALMHLSCGSDEVTLEGSVIGAVLGVNRAPNRVSFVAAHGHQQFEAFAGDAADVLQELSASGSEQAGLSVHFQWFVGDHELNTSQ